MHTDNLSVLVCSPEFYGIEYEINPWMSRNNQPDRNKARDQWSYLVENIYADYLNLDILGVAPVEGLPDMVFTANAGSQFGDTFVLSHFKHKERSGEIPHFAKGLTGLKYKVKSLKYFLPEGEYFEGDGDMLKGHNGALICGFGTRSTLVGIQTVIKLLYGDEPEKICSPIIFKLVSPQFYHLDTCFCPGKIDLYYPEAFDEISRRRLVESPFTLPVSKEDAERFVCNGVQFEINGRHVFVTPPPTANLKQALKNLDIEVIEADMSEFIKAGGAVRCLSNFLKLPEAR